MYLWFHEKTFTIHGTVRLHKWLFVKETGSSHEKKKKMVYCLFKEVFTRFFWGTQNGSVMA